MRLIGHFGRMIGYRDGKSPPNSAAAAAVFDASGRNYTEMMNAHGTKTKKCVPLIAQMALWQQGQAQGQKGHFWGATEICAIYVPADGGPTEGGDGDHRPPMYVVRRDAGTAEERKELAARLSTLRLREVGNVIFIEPKKLTILREALLGRERDFENRARERRERRQD
ncbi:hypothetical protein M885DRAFT_574254, partial [Pelagophyceae sp. CCMP2097]